MDAIVIRISFYKRCAALRLLKKCGVFFNKDFA